MRILDPAYAPAMRFNVAPDNLLGTAARLGDEPATLHQLASQAREFATNARLGAEGAPETAGAADHFGAQLDVVLATMGEALESLSLRLAAAATSYADQEQQTAREFGSLLP